MVTSSVPRTLVKSRDSFPLDVWALEPRFMFDGAASNTVIAKLSTETAEVGAASEVAPHDAVAFGRGLEPATGNASVIVAVDSQIGRAHV